jgi:hypothetical protein
LRIDESGKLDGWMEQQDAKADPAPGEAAQQALP